MSEVWKSIESWDGAEGTPAPLGASWVDVQSAWNFSLYSRDAGAVTLLIYTADDHVRPVAEVELDPLVNKTGRIWHCRVGVEQVPGAAHYAFRVDGPNLPRSAFRPAKVLTDPFAQRLFFPPDFSREAAMGDGANDGRAVLGVLPTAEWATEPVPRQGPRHTNDLVVYEMHVKGFTARANSGVAEDHRGTFRGIIDKIPYLTELGITAVELLPVHQYDPQEGNYWGYMTMSFFAPHAAYACDDAVAEFREMVDALHAAGIELWLDVVYNHTAEGGLAGPTYNLRGIDNDSYYIVGPDGSYANDSGCGNTTQSADLAMRVLTLTSLEYWAKQMGVDGFRFDLASVLTRDGNGVVTPDAAVIAEIGLFALRNDIRLVAEPWDLGAYELGRSFPGIMWRQWNGRFRDDVRGFVKGDDGLVPSLMRRVYASDDLFPDGPGDMYHPYQSVNFVTAHDGFSMYDLVSYNDRHNGANGHAGTDGSSDNRSWNCGWEGDAGVPAEVQALRTRQIKNFMALLMLSNGVPMFVAGDEFGNTQGGNNNPYNQDNETTWLDWDRLVSNAELFDFAKGMIALRKSRAAIARSRFWREDVRWFGTSGEPDLAPWSRSLAWWLSGRRFDEGDLYVMVNAYHEPLTFSVQMPGPWRRIVDTSAARGQHVVPDAVATDPGDHTRSQIVVEPHSIVVVST